MDNIIFYKIAKTSFPLLTLQESDSQAYTGRHISSILEVSEKSMFLCRFVFEQNLPVRKTPSHSGHSRILGMPVASLRV